MIYVTRHSSTHIVWLIFDEKTLRRLRIPGTERLAFTQIESIIDQLMQVLVTTLLEDLSDAEPLCASFVLDCRPFIAKGVQLKEVDFRVRFLRALEECIPLYQSQFPRFLKKLYLITPIEELLVKLDLPAGTLRNTVVLEDRSQLSNHLGSEIPPEYGGNSGPLAECDLLFKHKSAEKEARILLEAQDTAQKSLLATGEPTPADPLDYGGNGVSLGQCGLLTKHESDEEEKAVSLIPQETAQAESVNRQSMPVDPPELSSNNENRNSSSNDEEKPPLFYSKQIGLPPFVLDPKDLDKMEDLYPGKSGARIVPIDSGWLVKYGKGVRLAEAEALHLISTTTTIPVPRLIGAYILDDVCYIIMTHEAGVHLEYMWKEATEEEREKVLAQLRDAVKQLRAIKGTYIGGLHREICRDPLFDAGWSRRPSTYGPYDSEADLNEGIVQAMEDRFPKTEGGEPREISATEYLNRQLIRGMKNHEIVFTNGDLRPSNILVKEDRSIVIVDWGMSGFWPEYWEYFRARVVITAVPDWEVVVEKYIPPYYVEEFVMDHITTMMWN